MRGTDVTSGVLRRAVAGVRSGALPWLILVLSVGVIGMHSLGASHHPPATAQTTTATHDMVSMSTMSSMSSESPVPSAAKRPVASVAGFGVSVTAVTQATVMADTVMAGHGLMVMCLAVLPLLGLLLRRSGDGWFRLSRDHIHVPRSSADDVRAEPPPCAAVSLARLCILRT